MESIAIYLPIILSVVGLLYMVVKKAQVMKQDAGDGKMKEISDHIYEGALAFLKAEYRLLTFFVIGASVTLALIAYTVPTTHYLIVLAFVIGAIFSALAGNMGMKIATKTNVRTTQAAKTSLPNALKVSFGGGTVMGLGVAGLAVLGLTGFFILFNNHLGGETFSVDKMTMVLETLAEDPVNEDVEKKYIPPKTKKVLAPSVRKIVEEQDIDISEIEGTGKDGRISKGYLINLMGSTPQPSKRKIAHGPEERVKMTKLRLTIAKRLKDSQNNSAMLTTFNEVDMQNIMQMKKDYQDDFKEKYPSKS